jgi:hypothetical protein
MNDGSLTWPWVVEVQQDLDNAPRYVDGMRDLLKKSGLKGWQKDFDTLTRELTVHNDWVRTTVLPRARKTNRLPPEIYADNLKAYGVEADPRDLIQRAMFAYQQAHWRQLDSLARIYAAQRASSLPTIAMSSPRAEEKSRGRRREFCQSTSAPRRASTLPALPATM